MIRRTRDRALVTTGVVLVGLLVSTPDAGASGNCYNYGTPGYGQVFTDISYRGDCFEWPPHWEPRTSPTTRRTRLPRSGVGPATRAGAWCCAIRSAPRPEYIRPNEWKPSPYHNDAADYVELSA